jgi:tetratricopeptide (TPR) repeat protein
MSEQDFIFIGREREIALFKQMLDSPRERWILNIYGGGGLGKTKLLEQMRAITRERARKTRIFFTKESVDFYWTANQRELGLLRTLADQLESPGEFEPFYQGLAEYEQLMTQKEPPDPEQVRYQIAEIRERFLAGYRDLTTQGQVVLFFDTTEESAKSKPIADFWQNFLPHLRGNALVVAAGRQRIDSLPEDQTVFLHLQGFSVEDTIAYFRSRGLEIPPGIASKLCRLADGRPILIALAADWVTYGHAAEELVQFEDSESGKKEFEWAMVDRIRQLQPAEDSQAILAMAHLYRRFDEEILAHIFDRPLDWCVQLISHLSTLSFVKYRPPIAGRRGSCLLHDEMRRFVDQYVWSAIDPLQDFRPVWTRRVIEYYTERVKGEKDPAEIQNLNLEKLFYLMSINLAEGFDFSRTLFRVAIDHFDTDYMEAINAEVSRWESELAPQMQKEIAFREAIVLHRRERYDQAIEMAIRLVKDPDLDPLLRAESLARLIEFCADGGRLTEAVEYGKEGELICQQLSGQYPGPEVARIQGLLQNNLGFAYRQQGDLEQAIELYKRALNAYQRAGGPLSMVARIRNNLGFALARIGQADQAESQCLIALKDRLWLGIPYELGLSYNVLGTIYADSLRVNEAIESFKRAEREFEKAGSERGKALVYTAYGRLMRQWGWYKEQFAKEPFNPHREEYCQAQRLLEQAIEILRRVKDRANLSEALNEMGCLYRQRHEWEQAEQCFLQSKSLAEEIGNRVRVADNLQDLSLLYYQQGDFRKAETFARQASQVALQAGWYYLHGKAQRLLSDLAFARGDYDEAFQALALSCIYTLKHRPVSQVGQESAKTKLFYQEMVSVAEEKILALPTQELARKYCEYLIGEWISAGLAGAYPGFVERMRSLSQDYPFLAGRMEAEQ